MTNDENEILEIISEAENYLALTLLFFQLNNSQFEILTIIQDVLPSRVVQLFEAKRKVEQIEFLNEWWCSLPIGKESQFVFNFSKVRDIFPKGYPNEESKNNDVYRQSFLEMVSHAFKGNKIDLKSILHPAVAQMRYLFANRSEKKKTLQLNWN